MKRLDECTLDQLKDFTNIVEPLVDYIKETWEGSILPKGYKEFINNYEEYKGMNDVNIDCFTGFVNDTATSYSFPVATSIPHIAYDDREQGRDPLQMLISSCVSYGMQVQERRQALKEFDIKDMINIVLSGQHPHLFDETFKNNILKVYGMLEETLDEMEKEA
jgi:hypothetical protein